MRFLEVCSSLASSKIAKKVIISDARKDSQTPFSSKQARQCDSAGDDSDPRAAENRRWLVLAARRRKNRQPAGC